MRRPDPSDGRGVQVAITQDGRALLRRLQARRAAAMAERLARLTPPSATRSRPPCPRWSSLIARPLKELPA